MTSMQALAPAKVNLFLHVGAVDAEGYHPLSSLVAFADVGDRLSARPAARSSLTVGGRFAEALAGTGDSQDNLVLKALRALEQSAEAASGAVPPLELTLDKALPIAAGLGGGSSDAGAALRLAARFMGEKGDPDRLAERLLEAASVVGADGPMCLHPRSAWAEGRGERLTAEPRLPPLHAVLVNPRLPSPTGAVYRAYDAGPVGGSERPSPPDDWSVAAVIDWLVGTRNDLEAPAVALQPAIRSVLDAVSGTDGVGLSRMSGSGATVFGLYVEAEAADQAVSRLKLHHPDWWVVRTTLGSDLSALL